MHTKQTTHYSSICHRLVRLSSAEADNCPHYDREALLYVSLSCYGARATRTLSYSMLVTCTGEAGVSPVLVCWGWGDTGGQGVQRQRAFATDWKMAGALGLLLAVLSACDPEQGLLPLQAFCKLLESAARAMKESLGFTGSCTSHVFFRPDCSCELDPVP